MVVDWNARLNAKAGGRVKPSVIAEMVYLVQEYEAISFTAGQPSADLFPMEDFSRGFRQACEIPELFGYYHDYAGLVELREWIVQWMRGDGLLPHWAGVEHVLLTNGSQEGLNLLAEALIDPGDAVALEDPSYPEALLAFRKEGARLVPVPVDMEGPSLEELERVFREEGVRFFYSIVNFQNPSGASTSDARKEAVLELARRYDVVILEDDPYHYLRFEGAFPGSYIAMAGDDDRVVYLGSFSKILAPGLRCGWLVAPRSLVVALTCLRVACEIGLSAVPQYAVYETVRDLDMTSYLLTLQDRYKMRRDALVKALGEYVVPQGLHFEVPEGGFFIWGEIPGIDDIYSFARFAVVEERVGVVPGMIFSPLEDGGYRHIRFSYATADEATSREGARRLARALSAYLGGERSTD
ncbi:MAG: PLP-dependent aminotransferase family protein [Synergistales bacterium]|nr:PLP-dependent aminotransferase family protein [Synergistales bacterium]